MKAGLISLLFPPKCASCGELLKFEGFGSAELPALCPDCRKLWESEKLLTCGGCAKPVALCNCMTEELEKAHCNGYRKLVYYLHGKRASVQNRLLFRIKNTPDRRAVSFLAGELEEPVRELLEGEHLNLLQTGFVYIPRGRKAALETGTDQAKRLAEALSERCGIPVLPAVRRRWGRAKQQKKLRLQERRKNARRAYRLRETCDLKGKNVILIDDIVTTGSSMAAVARLLRSAGAERIFCLSVASDDCNQNLAVRQPTFKIDRIVR